MSEQQNTSENINKPQLVEIATKLIKSVGQEHLRKSFSSESLAVNLTLAIFSAQENVNVTEFRYANDPNEANRFELNFCRTQLLMAQNQFDSTVATVNDKRRFAEIGEDTADAISKAHDLGFTVSDLKTTLDIQAPSRNRIV